MGFLIEGAKAVANVDVLLRVEQVATTEPHRQAVVEERLCDTHVGHVSGLGDGHVLLVTRGRHLQTGRGGEGWRQLEVVVRLDEADRVLRAEIAYW